MSSTFFRRETGGVRQLAWAPLIGMLLATVVGGAAVAQAEKRSGFMNWPPELASRAPALADSIAHDMGEPPRGITFLGRDTLEVLLWNPGFWRSGAQSKQLPMESLPFVSTAAKQVARVVWTTFGRDAGINVIRVTFVRARRENYMTVMSREVAAQEVYVTFPRQYFESGQRWEPGIGIMQREGGSRESDR